MALTKKEMKQLKTMIEAMKTIYILGGGPCIPKKRIHPSQIAHYDFAKKDPLLSVEYPNSFRNKIKRFILRFFNNEEW